MSEPAALGCLRWRKMESVIVNNVRDRVPKVGRYSNYRARRLAWTGRIRAYNEEGV